MATSPQFVTTPKIGLADVVTANTARDGTGTIVTAFTAGASGARVEEVVLKATADPADSTVTMFIDITGSAGWDIYDEFDIGNPAAGSTTVESYRVSRTYDNLVLPAGAKIGFAITVALTSGEIRAWVFGGDF